MGHRDLEGAECPLSLSSPAPHPHPNQTSIQVQQPFLHITTHTTCLSPTVPPNAPEHNLHTALEAFWTPLCPERSC